MKSLVRIPKLSTLANIQDGTTQSRSSATDSESIDWEAEQYELENADPELDPESIDELQPNKQGTGPEASASPCAEGSQANQEAIAVEAEKVEKPQQSFSTQHAANIDTHDQDSHLSSPCSPVFDYDYELCEFGDLAVVLDDAIRFRVSSLSLRMASPVWNKTLDPESPFSSLQNEFIKERQIPVFRLYEDNQETLLNIFWIIHLQPNKTPTKASFQLLFEMAVLCDKYECTGAVDIIVRPWLDFWAPLALEAGHENWLFIGPTFGDRRNLEALSLKLACAVTVGEFGPAARLKYWPEGTLMPSEYIPDLVIDHIKSSRSKCLKDAGTIIKTWQMELARYDSAKTKHEVEGRDTCSEECESLAYGSFLRSLGRLQSQYCIFDADFRLCSFDCSIEELQRQFESIKILTQQTPVTCHYGYCSAPHRCRISNSDSMFHQSLEAIFSRIKGVSADCLLRYERPSDRDL